MIKMSRNDEQKSFTSAPINWYPGHMAKARREIGEKLSLVDLVLEVVDARMPLSSEIADLGELLKRKMCLTVMTKYDLCDKSVTDSLMKRLGKDAVAVDLMSGKGMDLLLRKCQIAKDEMNALRKQKGLKERSLRVMIVGVPNAGKSTLINRLVGKRATKTGNRPGVTTGNSWVRIHKDLELLDTPGILWPKLEDQGQAKILASFSSIRDEILNTMDLATFVLKKLEQLYPNYLEERYSLKLPLSDTLEEEFEVIAKKRGALQRGGIADYEKVATFILSDLREGRFGPITLDRMDS